MLTTHLVQSSMSLHDKDNVGADQCGKGVPLYECRPACLRGITGRTQYLVYFIPSPEPGAAPVSPSSLTSQSSACRSQTSPLSFCSQRGAVPRHGRPAGGGRLEGAGLRVCDHRRLLDVDAERRQREVAA